MVIGRGSLKSEIDFIIKQHYFKMIKEAEKELKRYMALMDLGDIPDIDLTIIMEIEDIGVKAKIV